VCPCLEVARQGHGEVTVPAIQLQKVSPGTGHSLIISHTFVSIVVMKYVNIMVSPMVTITQSGKSEKKEDILDSFEKQLLILDIPVWSASGGAEASSAHLRTRENMKTHQKTR
jgi:hypothetical protein